VEFDLSAHIIPSAIIKQNFSPGIQFSFLVARTGLQILMKLEEQK
jgi:hypothetical protein